MRNSRFGETAQVVAALRRLRELLPSGWSVESLDAKLVEVAAPDGAAVSFVVEVKRWTTEPTSRVAQTLSALHRLSPLPVLLLTDYTNEPLRRACRDLGLNFMDEAGWVFIRSEHPAILISTEGKDQRPPRQGNEVRRLNGQAAGRTIRALLEVEPPIGVRDLQILADVGSPGSVSKLLPTLAAADALERDDRGQVIDINRRALLNRWTIDYSFRASNNAATTFLAPRGLESLLDRIRSSDGLPATGRVAVTGSFAAKSYLRDGVVPVVPASRLVLYADRPAGAVSDLDLVEVEQAVSNVLIANPRDDELLEAPVRDDSGLPIVPLPQVLADLVGLPGRESLLAEQLMDQLAETDPLWRER